MVKTAVYTCITSAYDSLREPRVVAPGIDYVCFSDTPIDSKTWQVRPLVHCASTACRTARYHKLMSHRVLPDHELTLWLDGSYRIDGDLTSLIQAWLNGCDFTLRKHPLRLPPCLYAEAAACLRYGRGEPDAISAQVSEYRVRGYPERNGLYVTGILARRNASAVCELNEAWWAELERFSNRDQLSFPFVAWQRAFRFRAVSSPDHTHHHRPVLAWLKHAGRDPVSGRAARR